MSEENWCQKQLADEKLRLLLEKVDDDLAAAVCRGGCLYCGAKLHRSDYPRLPRGGPDWNRRHSFCCAECRRRRTPESVRFLGRRVYAGVVVVLVSAMAHGLSPERIQKLREALGIDSRTLERWRQWWLGQFKGGSFWKEARARLAPPVCEATLPLSLCERFEVWSEGRLQALLQWLAPVTAPSAATERVM